MAKTEALICFAVTGKLICVVVFAYTEIRFSHDKRKRWGACLVIFGGGSGGSFCGVFVETCVVGAHWNRLGEAILMGAHSMGFCEEKDRIIT